MQIHDTATLITGGSRGLGLALARALATHGSRLVLVARDRDRLDAAVAELRDGGAQAHGIAADIGDKDAIYPLAAQAAALIGPIDILFNNASTLGPVPMPLLLDTECEDLSRVIEVNVLGPFRLTRAIAGSMALRGGGLVINISSDAAVEAYPNWGAYGASKAALDHLTRTWSSELGETGVRFISVDPGEMDTDMHARALPDADRETLAAPAAVAARVVDMIRRAPGGARLVASSWEPSVAARH